MRNSSGVSRLLIVSGSRADYGLLETLHREAMVRTDCLSELVRLAPSQPYRFLSRDLVGSAARENFARGESRVLEFVSDAIETSSQLIGSFHPDVVVVLGDRIEILAPCIAATVWRIPVAHFCGGDVGAGTIDNLIRSAVSKLAHLHFVTHEEAARRVTELGEDPSRIFNVGSLAVDGWQRRMVLNREQVLSELGFTSLDRFCLVTCHPCALDEKPDSEVISVLREMIREITENGRKVVLTLPNLEVRSREFESGLKLIAEDDPHRAVVVTNELGHTRYLAYLEYADFILGNSSSGLYEAPLARKPTINIGFRQRGRSHGDSVIHCSWDVLEIREALRALEDCDFAFTYPYGVGGTASRALDLMIRKTPEVDLEKKPK